MSVEGRTAKRMAVSAGRPRRYMLTIYLPIVYIYRDRCTRTHLYNELVTLVFFFFPMAYRNWSSMCGFMYIHIYMYTKIHPFLVSNISTNFIYK